MAESHEGVGIQEPESTQEQRASTEGTQDMPVESASPSLQEDLNLKNALAATNPFTTPSIETQDRPEADPNSFIGRWAKRILAPLGAKPPQGEKKQDIPTPTESLP